MTRPTLPLTGGCLCGAVRYRITAAPLTLYACHCTDCQTMSGSAFGLSMPVARRSLEVTQGTLQGWERISPSGVPATARFCGHCGCRVYGERPSRPDRVVMRAGTLDDTSWVEPVAHIWTCRRQPWVALPDHLPTFETQPDDFAVLGAVWRQRFGG